MSEDSGRNARRRRNYERGRASATGGYRYWEQEEDRAIMAEDRPTDRELAEKLGRSVQAIQVRRTRLRALNPEGE